MTRQRTDYPLDSKNGVRDPHDRPNDLADAVTDRFKEVTDVLQERVGQVAEQALQYAEIAQDAVKQFKPFVQKAPQGKTSDDVGQLRTGWLCPWSNVEEVAPRFGGALNKKGLANEPDTRTFRLSFHLKPT